jgi:hypothetical protein
VSLLIQIIGSALILAAFAANQVGSTATSSRSYLAANAIGSLALAVSAVLRSPWGSSHGRRPRRRQTRTKG